MPRARNNRRTNSTAARPNSRAFCTRNARSSDRLPRGRMRSCLSHHTYIHTYIHTHAHIHMHTYYTQTYIHKGNPLALDGRPVSHCILFNYSIAEQDRRNPGAILSSDSAHECNALGACTNALRKHIAANGLWKLLCFGIRSYSAKTSTPPHTHPPQQQIHTRRQFRVLKKK